MSEAFDVLTRRVRATPQRTAIIDGASGTARSFRSLDASVEEYARTLAGLGIEAGDRLGLLVDTTVETFELIHATFRLGARVVPINHRNAATEVSRQLQTAAVDHLVCDPENCDLAVSGTADLPLSPVCTEATAELLALDAIEPEPAGRVTWDLDETMLIVFTSGTTGTAKAVPLTRMNLEWSAIASAFRLGTLPDDRWVCCLPVFHVGGFAPIIRTALYGTTAVVLEETEPAAIATATQRHTATGISLVPTLLHRVFESDHSLAESLRVVLIGGAETSQALLDASQERDVPIHPTYGLTETASQVATATPAEAIEHPGTVGHPLMGTEVTIVDDDGDELEAGAVGEIVVRGPTVTPGYLDGTATSTHGQRFRTGDLGYLDADGRLWVTGRVDDVIVTGGETVHAGTVETVLGDHPAVADAAVVGISDQEWGERVAALVVSDADIDAIDVREFCENRLAGYERPRRIRVVDGIPRTASGSVDRDAVRETLQGT